MEAQHKDLQYRQMAHQRSDVAPVSRIWARVALLSRAHETLLAERARWFVWSPVLFGTGIALYFALSFEPGAWTVLALPLTAAGLVLASRAAGLAHVAAVGLLLLSLGFVAAKVRTEATRAPVLERELRYAKVEGVVELIEPRPTRGERLTLRVTAIERLDAAARPQRVRIRVMRKTEGLKPGDAVSLRATLRPPAVPALPGGYDFARSAWFQGLGATGFSLAPARILRSSPAESPLRQAKALQEQVRKAIGDRIRAAVPGETGAIAVSLITGERGGITEATSDAYRDSGLVHILSISGLHMVIMAGSIYALVRIVLAAFPAIALRFATKKWAAAAALAGAMGYLTISGASIATLRAALMIAIMFLAVILDRQALAMRNVAIAALVILAVMPESLLDAGFQMSFAAVVSLIAAYEALRDRPEQPDRRGLVRPIAFFLGGIVLSTVIASLAVAPLGVYHFHRSQQYALLANLIAIPICNLIIMPAALVTLVLMPLGLEAAPLALMAKGIDAMTATAYGVAGLPGAIAPIAAIPDASFALMVFGGLWLTLWQTRWRALGLAGIGAGILMAGSTERPDIIAGRGGALVAVRGADGLLHVAGSRAGTYELSRWLEHDGDARPARAALRSKEIRCDGVGCLASTAGLRVAIARHGAATREDCLGADILVGGPPRPAGCTRPLAVLDRRSLRDHGTHAIYLTRDQDDGRGRGRAEGGSRDARSPDVRARIARIETVAGRRGARPWTMTNRGARALQTRRQQGGNGAPESPQAPDASHSIEDEGEAQ